MRRAYWANHDAAVTGQKLTDEDVHVDIGPSHVRHCTDLLRQSLMCHADTTIEVVDEEINGVHGFGRSIDVRIGTSWCSGPLSSRGGSTLSRL